MKKEDKFLIADKEIFDKLLHIASHTTINKSKKKIQKEVSIPEGTLGMVIINKATDKKKEL